MLRNKVYKGEDFIYRKKQFGTSLSRYESDLVKNNTFFRKNIKKQAYSAFLLLTKHIIAGKITILKLKRRRKYATDR